MPRITFKFGPGVLRIDDSAHCSLLRIFEDEADAPTGGTSTSEEVIVDTGVTVSQESLDMFMELVSMCADKAVQRIGLCTSAQTVVDVAVVSDYFAVEHVLNGACLALNRGTQYIDSVLMGDIACAGTTGLVQSCTLYEPFYAPMIFCPDGTIVGSIRWNRHEIGVRKTPGGFVSLIGHEEVVRSLHWLTGGRLASGDSGGSIRIWDVKTYKCEHVLTGHSASVRSLALLFSGQLASGSDDGCIKIWDTVGGHCTGTLLQSPASSVQCLCVLLHGELVAGYMNGSIRIWDTATQVVVCETLASGGICDIKSLRNGMIAFTAEACLKLWQPMTKSSIALQTQEPGCYTIENTMESKLAVLYDQRLAYSFRDTITLWRITADGQAHREEQLICPYNVLLMCVMPDRSLFSLHALWRSAVWKQLASPDERRLALRRHNLPGVLIERVVQFSECNDSNAVV